MVQDSKIAVIFFCGVVIGAGGRYLIVEVAEGDCSASDSYSGVPFASCLVPGDALVF